MVKSFIFQSIVLFIWLTTTIATILAIIAPYLEFQRIAFAQNIYWVLRLFCHQIPSRCFWIWGSNMGLCSRCFSLDTSFSLCIIIMLYFKFYKILKTKFMFYLGIILLIPLLVDGSIATATNYISNNFTRSITGMLFGIGFGTGMILFKKKGKCNV